MVGSAESPAIGALVASIRLTAKTLIGSAVFPGSDEVALTVKVWGPSAEPRKRGTRTTAVNVPEGLDLREHRPVAAGDADARGRVRRELRAAHPDLVTAAIAALVHRQRGGLRGRRREQPDEDRHRGGRQAMGHVLHLRDPGRRRASCPPSSRRFGCGPSVGTDRAIRAGAFGQP